MAAVCTSGICTRRKHLQEIDFGPEYQLVFELRPAHDPTKAYGFVNCVISLKDLSSSIWTWYRDKDKWAVRKIIDIPAEPADPALLPPMLKSFGAVPPLVTDIDLSMDDRFLYVSCWGTGDLLQYDVSDPFAPKLAGKVRIGGIVSRATHPGASNGALNGGPQMVEVSRDGKRVYFTNSLYGAVDPQFYPDGIDGWMVKLDAERMAASRSTRSSSSPGPKVIDRIRFACKAATARPIRTATPEENDSVDLIMVDMDRGRRTRHVSRSQPGDGLVVRGCARLVSTQSPGGVALARTNRVGSRARCREHVDGRTVARNGHRPHGAESGVRDVADWLGGVACTARSSDAAGSRNANGLCWPDDLVVRDGGFAWRRPHADSRANADM